MLEQPSPRRPGLIVHGLAPLNAETLLALQTGALTPADRFYIRSHFAQPSFPARLVVDGAVESPLSLPIDELMALPRRALAVTLECAGNGRSFLEPKVQGEQWRLGAVSTAEWAGASLRDVLARAKPTPAALEVVFRGADSGTPPDLGKRIAYERSLTLEQARSPDVLLAYAMNGAPLPAEHGAPLRLVVPGWYGMASVKWLARIRVTTRPFRGFYQRARYVIGQAPLTTIQPRAVIAWPEDGAVLARGGHAIRGYAWSGAAAPSSVEVSVDAGGTWHRAELLEDRGAYAWREWRFAWDARAPGTATLAARTMDAAGNTQPLRDRWNELGYANNAVRLVQVSVG